MEKAEEKLELITKYFDEFSTEQVQQLLALEPLYKEWNSKINVISRKDEDSLYLKHVLHSLSIAAVFEFWDGMEVLDLGTGGGFPGIPLAIFFPGVRFHLVDSIGKKIKVVEAVAEAIGLKNITAQHTRAEEIRGRKFDTVVSRAVAPLGELWKWGKPLLGGGKGQRANGKRQTANGRGETANGKGQMAKGKEERGMDPNGLICLKGGDLTKEIAESHCRPRMIEITEIFDEPVFEEKYILYVPLNQ